MRKQQIGADSHRFMSSFHLRPKSNSSTVGTSLVVRCLRHHASIVRSREFDPWSGTKILYAVQHSQRAEESNLFHRKMDQSSKVGQAHFRTPSCMGYPFQSWSCLVSCSRIVSLCSKPLVLGLPDFPLLFQHLHPYSAVLAASLYLYCPALLLF